MVEIQNPVMKRSQSEKEALFNQVIEMMAIPGKSGEESLISKYIQTSLLAAGAKRSAIREDRAHRRTRIQGQVGNLAFHLPGTFRAPRRMLSAHLDTVPICVGCEPRRTGMKVTSSKEETGLGADNRAGCGVILSAALEKICFQRLKIQYESIQKKDKCKLFDQENFWSYHILDFQLIEL